MYNTIIYLVGFLCLVGHSDQRSTPTDDSYVAAVIEYQVLSDINTNLNNYIRLIKEAADQDADIVVFPEMTLGSRRVPVPIHDALKDHPIPAENPGIYDEVLVKISTAAKENAVYVVINLQEVMDCENVTGEYCPEKKEYLFNTNVVFDRAGAVIDRYRKINLFGEFTRTPALTPDLGVFTTDFGVTFGHFICFDLMFQVPAVQIVQKNNLTDIIFTTMWFSEMPYLTAVEIQQAYAYAMNVNFLASGANNVRVGSAGSGIFSGKAGALVSIMPGVPTTKVMVARVPKVPGQVTGTYPGPIDDDVNHDNLVLKADPSLPSHTSRLLVPGYQDFILSEDGVVCRFKVNLKQTENTTVKYRAFIQDSGNTYVLRHVGVAACSIVACEFHDVTSCPYKFTRNQGAHFKELEIKMSTYGHKYNASLKCNDVEYYGISLKSNHYPLEPKNFTITSENKNGGRMNLVHKINSPQSELISFGIYGRIYDRDTPRTAVPATVEDVNNYIEIEKVIYGLTDKEL
ncbi:vanin-like protein 2 isoform X2 [Leptidea sinapis]|uniref:vanin-like protein 2 isoform X2 n=1 Tax=Leptidea sinapis TaxID=189913 RepID=UPI00213C812D|nr:vanin-like protein 2 isoform X2 [Leptidea sinapis]